MTVYKKIDLKCTQFCGALSALLNFEKDVFFFTSIEILRTPQYDCEIAHFSFVLSLQYA